MFRYSEVARWDLVCHKESPDGIPSCIEIVGRDLIFRYWSKEVARRDLVFQFFVKRNRQMGFQRIAVKKKFQTDQASTRSVSGVQYDFKSIWALIRRNSSSGAKIYFLGIY